MGPSNMSGNIYMQFEPTQGTLYEIGGEKKFAEFKIENNIKRNHLDLGLNQWNPVPYIEAEAKVMNIPDDSTTGEIVHKEQLTIDAPQQDVPSPKLAGASKLYPGLEHLQDDGI